MLSGNINHFQRHGSNTATAIYTPPLAFEGMRMLAPGGVMQLTWQSPTHITFYDGVATQINLPGRASLPIGLNFVIANTGQNAQFTVTVKSLEWGDTIATIAPKQAALITCMNNNDTGVSSGLFDWQSSTLTAAP